MQPTSDGLHWSESKTASSLLGTRHLLPWPGLLGGPSKSCWSVMKLPPYNTGGCVGKGSEGHYTNWGERGSDPTQSLA